MARSERPGRDFIARHGETVLDAAARLQDDAPHTLTRAGFAQADEIGTLWGVMTGAAGGAVAPGLPQGSIVPIERGIVKVVHRGSGQAPA